MKLLTDAIRKKLVKQSPLYHTAEAKDIKVICKWFNPCGSQTWYGLLMEDKFDDEVNNDVVYAFADLGGDMSDFAEAGDISLKEFESIRLPFGLGIERDLHFQEGKYTLQDLFDGKRP